MGKFLRLGLLGMLLTAGMILRGWTGEPSPRTDDSLQWRGAYGGPERETTLLARNPAEWLRMQSLFNLSGPLPTIDFATHMVAAVGLGSRSTGGYSATILGVEERGGILYVRYRERTPQPGEFVTQAFTAPYHVKVFPRSDPAKVLFEKVKGPERSEEKNR